MRVVLHAGLHKSGTTTVQFHWRAAYGNGSEIRYPPGAGRKLPGHHGLVWPMLDAFSEQRANDLVWSSTLSRRRRHLRQVVSEAVRDGVEVLVISSEELDRIEAADAPRLAAVLEPHDVTVVLTLTRPLHRWCSGWQELVKHGCADYPVDVYADLAAHASLQPGRIEAILRLIPASRRILRLVRTAPPEESLAADLAQLVGLPWPPGLQPQRPRNTSMGVDVEILRRINRADLTVGTLVGDGRSLVAELKGDRPRYSEKPELAARYEPPPQFWAAAEAERAFLADPTSADIEVSDPHRQLDNWLDPRPPDWYAEIARREAVLPELDAPREIDELLWRARQERSALRVLLGRAEARIELLQKQATTSPTHVALDLNDARLLQSLRGRVRRAVGRVVNPS